MQYTIRKATLSDLKNICKFTDFWLAGRGCRVHAPGAVNDCFISPSQHTRYIQKYNTLIATLDNIIIGWAVTQPPNTMIHLLIHGKYRNQGIGAKLLKTTNPTIVRSKTNQSTGNPTPWYLKHGYEKIDTVQSQLRKGIDKIRPNREKIIDVLQQKNQRHPQ